MYGDLQIGVVFERRALHAAPLHKCTWLRQKLSASDYHIKNSKTIQHSIFQINYTKVHLLVVGWQLDIANKLPTISA